MKPQRYRKVGYVWAERQVTAGQVETPEGTMTYEAGDYIVADSPPTHVWPVKAAIFERTYEPLAPERVALDRELDEFAGVIARMGRDR